jgi:hypothetical protein
MRSAFYYERVHRYRHSIPHYQRVDVNAPYFILLDADATETDEYLPERASVDLFFAAKLAEELAPFQIVHHFKSIAHLYRGNAKQDVANGLDKYAAETEHHARSELLVTSETADELTASTHHLLDENTVELARRSLGYAFIRISHSAIIANIQLDDAQFRLVGQARRTRFQNHRETYSASRIERIVKRRRQFLSRDRYPVSRQQLF